MFNIFASELADRPGSAVVAWWAAWTVLLVALIAFNVSS
jgi:hypothetical protein